MRIVPIPPDVFEKANKTQKACLLAYDVLCQLIQPRFNLQVETGDYFELYGEDHEALKDCRIGKEDSFGVKAYSARKVLESQAKCHVCAKGALIVSKVTLNGDMEFGYGTMDVDEINKALAEYFDLRTADDIESLFEKHSFGDSTIPDSQLVHFGCFTHVLADGLIGHTAEEIKLAEIMRNYLFNGEINVERHPRIDNDVKIDKRNYRIYFETKEYFNPTDSEEVETVLTKYKYTLQK